MPPKGHASVHLAFTLDVMLVVPCLRCCLPAWHSSDARLVGTVYLLGQQNGG